MTCSSSSAGPLSDTELKPGAVTEVVNVTGQFEKQIDLNDVALAHNVTAEEFDRLPKTRTLPGHCADRSGRQPGRHRRRLPGQRRQRRREHLHGRRRDDEQPAHTAARARTPCSSTCRKSRLRPAASTLEYGGALGGVISAVTKSGGNTFQAKVTTTIGQRLSAPARFSASFSARRRQDRSLTFRTTSSRTTATRSGFDRRPIVRDRLFFFGSFRRSSSAGQQLPVLERHESGSHPIDANELRKRWQAHATQRSRSGERAAC